MPFLTLNGITIPLTKCEEELQELGDRERAFSGQYGLSRRATKRRWKCMTKPVAGSLAETIKGLVSGVGHCWRFDDASLYDKKGLSLDPAGSAVIYLEDLTTAVGGSAEEKVVSHIVEYGRVLENADLEARRYAISTGSILGNKFGSTERKIQAGSAADFSAIDSATVTADSTRSWAGGGYAIKVVTSGAVNSTKGGVATASGVSANASRFVNATAYLYTDETVAAKKTVEVYIYDHDNAASSTVATVELETGKWTRVHVPALWFGSSSTDVRMYFKEATADQNMTFFVDGLQMNESATDAGDGAWYDGTRPGGVVVLDSLRFMTSKNYTFIAWVSNPQEATATGSGRYLLDLLPTAANGDYPKLSIIREASDGDTYFKAELDASTEVSTNSAVDYNDGDTYHTGQMIMLTGVIRSNPGSGEFNVELYEGGTLVDSANGTLPDLSVLGGENGRGGVGVKYTGGSDRWMGAIDDLTILPYAMDAASISALATRGRFSSLPECVAEGDFIREDQVRVIGQLAAVPTRQHRSSRYMVDGSKGDRVHTCTRFDVRTISTEQERGLTSIARSDHLRVRVDSDGVGTWVDLTDLYGVDWVKSARINATVDNPLTTATVTLRREYESLSLVGLMTGSRVNASSTVVDIAREIKIETAVIGGDTEPASADWVLVFHGYIDDIDFGGNKPVMRLTCRDLGAELADTFIEAIAVRGAAGPGGRAVETVMQNILTAALGGGAPTLYTPTSPSWNIIEYKQEKAPVLSAILALANQIGWDLRYKYRSGTAQYELTLSEPDRALAGGVLRTFTDVEYYAITQAAISRKNIRNRVKVTYNDQTQEIRDTGGTPYKATYIAEDAASKTKYGTRYMEIAYAPNIDSAAEAQTMAENIRDDLKEPTLTHVAELPYFWPVELGDYYTFSANDVHYDTDQSLAVVGFSHILEQGKCRTSLQTRGTPSAGTNRWLALEGRPGVGLTTDDYADAAAGNPAGEAGGPGQIIVTYDDPRVAAPPVLDWAYTECHVSTSSGFTPADSTLKDVGRVTRFVVGNLIAGTTYYVKLIIFDKEHNVASTSTQVTQAAGLLGPSQVAAESEVYTNIVPNSAFGVWTPPLDDQTANPPDGWETVKTTGGTALSADAALWGAAVDPGVYFDTTTMRSGGSAIKLTLTGSLAEYYGIRTSEFVPIEENEVYEFLYTVTRNLGCTVGVYAVCYQSDKSTITQTIAIASTGPTSWSQKRFKRTIAANTRYIKVAVVGTNNVGSAVVQVDRVEVKRAPDSFSTYDASTTTALVAGSFTKITFDTETFDYGNNFAASTFTAPRAGEYQFSSVVRTNSVANGSSVQSAIYVNGTIAEAGPTITNNSGGALNLYSTVGVNAIQLSQGDTVDVYVWTDDAAPPSTGTGAAYTNFRGTYKL